MRLLYSNDINGVEKVKPHLAIMQRDAERIVCKLEGAEKAAEAVDFYSHVDGSGWADMQLTGQKKDNTFPVTFNTIKILNVSGFKSVTSGLQIKQILLC